MKEPKEGLDFEVIPDDPDKDVYGITSVLKLLRKPWKDVVIRLGTLKFSGDDTPRATFEFELVRGPEGITESQLHTDKKFSQFIGSIIEKILNDQWMNQEEYGFNTVRDSDITIVEEE